MIRERVDGLRKLMKEHGVQAYIIPSTDPHQSEYLPALWMRRPFISGFTGSAGDVVVTETAAGLWIDSRYFLQAADQLDAGVYTLFKFGLPGVPSFKEWLADTLEAGDRVGVDPRLMSHSEYKSLAGRLGQRDVVLAPISDNLVDAVWTDRPPMPPDPVLPHDIAFAGESVDSKLERLRAKMASEGCGAHVVTTLDSIAWLCNIRGRDVEYNPVAIAYAVVTDGAATLYVDPAKVTEDLRGHLGESVSIAGYDAFEQGLAELNAKGAKVWIDPATCSQWVAECLSPGARLFCAPSPVTLFKALKNEVEVEGMRKAHVRDGVAMVRFLKWLEEAVPAGGVTELGICDKLVEFRSQGEHFRGPSFGTIASYKEHGAVIHYEPAPETDVAVGSDGILLVDSGGQYLDGTTDITRTLTMGAPTAEQKDRFTRVLQGLIKLIVQPFPEGTAGRQIDSLSRLALWNVGLNFMHGVGHGIGSHLCVHEGPQAISYYRCTGVALEPGMACTIEPGFYKDGEYGLRTENVAVVRDAPEVAGGDAAFRRFEDITLCPIDLNLVEKNLLAADEKEWLNGYHRKVRETLSPLLDADEAAWLEKNTRPI